MYRRPGSGPSPQPVPACRLQAQSLWTLCRDAARNETCDLNRMHVVSGRAQTLGSAHGTLLTELLMTGSGGLSAGTAAACCCATMGLGCDCCGVLGCLTRLSNPCIWMAGSSPFSLCSGGAVACGSMWTSCFGSQERERPSLSCARDVIGFGSASEAPESSGAIACTSSYM